MSCCCCCGTTKSHLRATLEDFKQFQNWLATGTAAPNFLTEYQRAMHLFPYFMYIAALSKKPLGFPSRHIQLVWHLHALYPQKFIPDLLTVYGRVFNLNTSFISTDATSSLWLKHFQKPFPEIPDAHLRPTRLLPIYEDTCRATLLKITSCAHSMEAIKISSASPTKLNQKFARLVDIYSTHKLEVTPTEECSSGGVMKLIAPPMPLEFLWQVYLWMPEQYAQLTDGKYFTGPLPHSVVLNKEKEVAAKIEFARLWQDRYHEDLKLRTPSPSSTTETTPLVTGAAVCASCSSCTACSSCGVCTACSGCSTGGACSGCSGAGAGDSGSGGGGCGGCGG
ncbi:hypothetical protein Pelo_880 [Pelomyxa schiedti]|nr:hypothetical protein Pelo_880 [Pelomyxa schiedti]